MLAVIGSAGRGSDASRMTRVIYDAMYDALTETMEQWGCRKLVSGGAAFADHLAVRAFLDGAAEELVLFLPAPFGGGAFEDRGDGRTANRYHRAFSKACDIDSLDELQSALTRAKYQGYNGFKRRNLEVADAASQGVVAFTFGRDWETCDIHPDDAAFRSAREAGLKDGGTAHTWQECWKAARKRHVSLTRLEKVLKASPSP